ncbi:class I SAM-dependent methyltransferase [Halorubrum sp. SS5]|nr:class I SAM-dependent methyltransferase [Halorubrum sp. SS5]
MTQEFDESQEFYRDFFSDERDIYYSNRERYDTVFDIIKNRTADNRKQALDIGAGRGTITEYLVDKYDRVRALDIVPNESINSVRKKNKSIDFTLGKLPHLPFKSDKFDMVVCSEVLEHVKKENQESSIEELSRVVSSSGVVILSTPNPRSIHEITRPSREGQHRENWVHPTKLYSWACQYFGSVERAGSYYIPAPITYLASRVPGVSRLRYVSEQMRKKDLLNGWGLYQYYILHPKENK